MSLRKHLTEVTAKKNLLLLSKKINDFMQETMVEIDDEILEYERNGGGKEDVRRMKIASDEAHEHLKYLRGMFREISEA